MLAANPYRIVGPALISFSGGRTSGYMLRMILDAHEGVLPPDVVVTFANTGKERPETLDFVQECASRWGVHVRWLEWVPGEHGERFTEVSHNSASRNGEPFKALIRQKQYLPNPVTSFCTIELKIRVMRDFCRSIGWDHWDNIVGLRWDEQPRVVEALARENERWVNILPLNTAHATKRMVLDFWWGANRRFESRQMPQGFDLALKDYEGNCDLCFKKGMGTVTHEQSSGAIFDGAALRASRQIHQAARRPRLRRASSMPLRIDNLGEVARSLVLQAVCPMGSPIHATDFLRSTA